MSIPYEIPPMAGIDVLAAPVVVPIKWPHRSNISKIVVVQTTGTIEQFTIALYNNPEAEGSITVSDSIGDDVGKIPDDCFRVTPDMQADVNGKVLYFSDHATGGYGFVFFSQALLPGRQGQRDDTVYLKITPTGSGPKKFAVCIGGVKEVG